MDPNADPCDAIHADYLAPPVEALRRSLRIASHPSFRPLVQGQLQG